MFYTQDGFPLLLIRDTRLGRNLKDSGVVVVVSMKIQA